MSFPPKTTFVDVPDPASPPVGAAEVTSGFLNDLQDYVLGLPETGDVEATANTAVAGTIIVKFYDGTLWPVRPNTSLTGQHVLWIGPTANPIGSGGTATGGTRLRAPFDLVAYS